MNNPALDPIVATPASRSPLPSDTALSASAVSWGAILGGAAAAAALSLILVVLGVGLGFTAASPWQQNGASATTIGVSSILWVILTSLFASALGGYLTGRLRARWLATHVDEVYFRDTAHGFLAWAVATLVTVGLLTSAIGSIVGTGIEGAASLTGAAATAAGGVAATTARSGSGDSGGGIGYFTDSLFRKDAAAATPTTAAAATPSTAASSAPSSPGSGDTGMSPAPTGEVTRIFVQSLRTGSLSTDDTHYLGQLVAQRTGLSQPDAERRVTDVFGRAKAAADEAVTKAKEAAEHARKVAAYASLWIFVALLVGAFGASLAATFGGRQRDR